MRAFVSGAAGFIGAVVAGRLLARGDTVVGIDNFLDSYAREIREDRLRELQTMDGFEFHEANLVEANLPELLDGVDYIFHLAAQAGVRTSWGKRFEIYTESNILATQKLLEAAREKEIHRFVYAGSSSVYGNPETMPTSEDAPVDPISPYAVSKLAGEHLCDLYRHHFRVPTVVLRYFTVYGVKPRPDMAVCIFVRAMMEDREIEVFGDGEQLRGMANVEDVARANLLAAEKECVGEVINIGGGTSISVNALIGHLERITGKQAKIRYTGPVTGDARHTMADIRKAKQVLRWEPQVELVEGLERTVASMMEYYYPEVR